MKNLWPMLIFSLGLISSSNSVLALDITLSSPADGESVDYRYDVVGQVSDSNANVIVVIHPVSVSEFWTQPPVMVNNNGQWRVKVYFGRQGMDRGVEYEVRAFANPQSQAHEGKYDVWPTAEARSNVVTVTRR